jgi:hypothetical protein
VKRCLIHLTHLAALCVDRRDGTPANDHVEW